MTDVIFIYMSPYILIKVPFVINSFLELESHLNICDAKGFELVTILPTKFEEIWLVFKKKQTKPWWKLW